MRARTVKLRSKCFRVSLLRKLEREQKSKWRRRWRGEMKTLVRKPRDSRTNAASEWRSLTALTDKRPIPQSNKVRASFRSSPYLFFHFLSLDRTFGYLIRNGKVINLLIFRIIFWTRNSYCSYSNFMIIFCFFTTIWPSGRCCTDIFLFGWFLCLLGYPWSSVKWKKETNLFRAIFERPWKMVR